MKNFLAGKYALCLQRARAKLVTSADTETYDQAVQRCTQKFDDKCYVLDLQCPCPNGDGETMESFILSSSSVIASIASCGGVLPFCGDGVLNVLGEECDGSDLDEKTCASLGFAGGTLACTALCKLDTSGCERTTCTCGNAAIDPGESCDQGNLDGATCVTLGFAGGTLACGAGCAFDTSDCYDTRFVDNADGTITDNETGLQWEKKVTLDSTVDSANPHDADNIYFWSNRCTGGLRNCQPSAAAEAVCIAGVEGDPGGCGQCPAGEGTCTVDTSTQTIWEWVAALNASNFAAHADWRIPTRDELAGIVDYDRANPAIDPAFHGASCSGACTDITNPACACTPYPFNLHYYWSASTQASTVGSGAWAVEYRHGIVITGGNKAGSKFVRAVRGGS